MRRFGLATAITLVLCLGATPVPAESGPGFLVMEAQNYADSFGRTVDQVSNPEYALLRSSDAQTYAHSQVFGDRGLEYTGDPLRRVQIWDRRRGYALGIAYRNRYGATLRGYLWGPFMPFTDPVTGEPTDGPLPAVVMVNGLSSPTNMYFAEAQGLAESGYIVMQFDPQGTNASDADPDPKSVYCDPNGSWKQPQEMGFRETGACAGQTAFQEDLVEHDLPAILAGKQDGVIDLTELQYTYGAGYALGAIDAVAWLLSDANPWRSLVDETRVGIVGHSLGGFTALMAGNGDPLRRFRTAVSWDTYGTLTGPVTATVPTMIQQSEQESVVGPHLVPPPPRSLHITREAQTDLQDACLPSAFLVLRSSTHNEWQYVGPDGAPFMGASRKGERVGHYFTLAWLDRFLKGATTSHVRGDEAQQASSAVARLKAATFDDSSDRSSVGTGAFDPLLGRNVPYTIASEQVADHLSFLYESSVDLDPCP